MTNVKIGATLAVLALFTGCASESGVDRAGKAATGMASMKTLCDDANKQIDKTLAALNSIAAVKSGDAKPAFSSYVSEVNAANDMAADAKATADEMRAKGRAFFSEWEKQIDTIQDADLKAKAKARSEERSKEYAKIEEAMGTAKGKWNTFSSDLSDLKKYLDNDLSPKGIESASGLFKKSNLDGVDLKNAITAVSSQLEKVRAELSPGK